MNTTRRNFFHISRRCQCSLLISSMLFQGTLNAQSPLSANDPVDLDSVNVTGVRASIQKSLLDKRNAVGMVDAITAEDFGKFPDLNLSESLQRISGITLDRGVTGEGSAINLRGLEVAGAPRFTKAYGQLDMSLNYHTSSRVSVQAQVLHLTREQRIDQSITRYLPYGVTELDRRFMLGLRAAF